MRIGTTNSAETGPEVLAILRDRDSENTVKGYLTERGVVDARLLRGGVDDAVDFLGRERSPRLLIVDLSENDDPVGELCRLTEYCDPRTRVIAVGDRNDVAVYRGLKELGVSEYFYKPLAFDLLAHACDPVFARTAEVSSPRAGRLIIVFGARGGVGTTTIAVNTAWHLAEVMKRRVILLDLDLQAGDAVMHLDTKPSGSLSEALKSPDRVDNLLIERAVTRLTDRLDLLASLEPFGEAAMPEEDAVLALTSKLQARYRYVVVDLPFWTANRFNRLLNLPATLVLVSDETLASARDALRWKKQIETAPAGSGGSVLLLLNKAHAAGTLTDAGFENALGQKPDIIVPYQSQIAQAASLGQPAIAKSEGLRYGLTTLFRRFPGEGLAANGSLFRRVFRR